MNSSIKINTKLHRILLLGCWALVFNAALRVLARRVSDPDLWWHLASGRYLIENQTFLKTEVFSHSFHGAEWINFEWLGQVVFYFVVKCAGLSSIYYLKIFLALVVLFVFGYLLRYLGARSVGFLLLMMLGFNLLHARITERMELFSLIFFPLFLLILLRGRNASPQKIKRTPWILFALMVLWCNLHGGFIYGLGLVFLMGLGAHWSKENKDYLSMMRRSLLMVSLGTLVNPYGPKLFLALFHHLQQFNKGLDLIVEWAPSDFSSAPVFWFFFLVVSMLFIGAFFMDTAKAKFWGPALVCFLAWSGFAFRNMVLAVMVAIPFCVDIVSGWKKWRDRPIKIVYVELVLMISLILYFVQTPVLAWSFAKEKIQWNRFPVGACQFVKENIPAGKMFNSYEFGGYIEWVLGQKWPVYMDGRYLFQPLLVEQHKLNIGALSDPFSKEWTDYMRRNEFDYAITNYGHFVIPISADRSPFSFSPLNVQFPRSDWALVFWDDAACVFVRRQPRFASLIETYEYKSLWPYNLDQMSVLLKTKAISHFQAKDELERHRTSTGFTFLGSEMAKLIHVE